ncbi:hypothetical protein [Mesobacterium pallidum]|uniref:hypothetical protein n=1 Tax=Mesobacterium pallidum TaxID=2872037 RepID=UPI001EE307EC|nr:hypothetical protein [Mesobacterium pallidum]
MPGGTTYSRVVAWLKVILPLTALALLSTVFLLSRTEDSEATLPFAEGDLADRLRSQRMTEPVYAGTTEGGDSVIVRAETAMPDLETEGGARAETVTTELRLVSGITVNVSAAEARLNDPQSSAELIGDVVIVTSDGYRVETARIASALDRLDMSAPAVLLTGPSLRLEAGAMRINRDGTAEVAYFTGGVKLVYQPPKGEN